MALVQPQEPRRSRSVIGAAITRQGIVSPRRSSQSRGFESLAERQLCWPRDFCGEVTDVLSQRFRLRFTTVGGATDRIAALLVGLAAGCMLLGRYLPGVTGPG